jgi:uncharacterized damage-inducible protein DinB
MLSGRQEEATTMDLTELFLGELESEVPATRRVLERVPEGQDDWKPHDKSMAMGYLAQLVATIFGWVDMTVNQDFLDFNPPDGKRYTPPQVRNNKELLAAFDEAVAKARAALKGTTEAHLMTSWQMRSGGQVLSEQPRYQVIRDGVFNHMAHHRGQLTVYLRLNDKPVPSIYGPTADEKPWS